MSNFQNIVATSDVLKARFATIADYVIEAVENEHGVTLDRSDVVNFVSVQNSTLANSEDYKTEWKADCGATEAVKQAEQRKQLKEALAAHGEDNAAHDAAIDQISKLKPHERMSFAREQGLGTGKIEPIKASNATPEQKAELLRQNGLLRGGAKIAHARANGLL